MTEEGRTAYVAMSGGVDSAVAAYLMMREGYRVTGITYALCDDGASACADARAVCDRLGIPHRLIDLRDRFKTCVTDYFIAEYEACRTPNPCVECNRYIKFSVIPEDGVLATGHYARIGYDDEQGRYYVKRALDPAKDQSYMLYGLSQETLASVRFPLGDLSKDEVRRIAEEQGFTVAHKKDSQDICFVPNGDYASYITEHTGRTYEPGLFTDMQGHVLGEHRGLIHYTIGQRRGLGLALPESLYVRSLDPAENRVILCRDEELYTDTVTADHVCLMKYASLEEPRHLSAKIRYAHRPQPATVRSENDTLRVRFDEPQRAVTPGQSVVIYDGDDVVGGGIISL